MTKKSTKPLKPQHSPAGPDLIHIVADFFLKVEQLAREYRAAAEASASSAALPSTPSKAKARKPHALHKFYEAFHRGFRPACEAGTYRYTGNGGLPVKRDGKPISVNEIAKLARSTDPSIAKSTAEKYARLFVIVKTIDFRPCPRPPDPNAAMEVKRQWLSKVCDSLKEANHGKFLKHNCPDELVEDLAITGGILW